MIPLRIKVTDIRDSLSPFKELGEKKYPQIIFPTSFWDSVSQLDQIISQDVLLKECRRIKGNLSCLQPLKKPKKPSEPYLKHVPLSYTKKYERTDLERYDFPSGRFWANILASMLVAAVAGGGVVCFFVLVLLVGGAHLPMELGIMICLVLYFVAVFIAFIKIVEPKSRYEYKEVYYSASELLMMQNEENERYEYAKNRYSEELNQYERKLAEYNEVLGEQVYITNELIYQITSSYIKSFFKPSEAYSVVDVGPQRGRSEDKLFAGLMKKIPNSVHIDTRIAGYYPDLMISTSNNVYIDVEIDEPYDMETHKEIHYIGGEDEARNKRIGDKNWVVVRFSEKQILKNCDSCIRIIEDLKQFIETGDIDVLYDQLLESRDSILDNRWSKEEARLMALNNYRDNYIINPETETREATYEDLDWMFAEDEDNTNVNCNNEEDNRVDNEGLPF